MHAMLASLHDWLQETTLPKLLVYTTPGLILGEDDVAWCRQHLKHLDAMHAGAGFHYPQEENPHGIGRAFLTWYRSR
jgi:haloalkane dehalogenase